MERFAFAFRVGVCRSAAFVFNILRTVKSNSKSLNTLEPPRTMKEILALRHVCW